MSIDETGIRRWSRLKKARQDRATRSETTENTEDSAKDRTHGSAVPVAFPVEVEGEFRPWLPPLTDDTAADDETTGGGEVEGNLVLSDEDKAVAEEMNLPDIESLEEGSDYSAFLSDGVPDALRRLALRKLWATNPLLGIRDGLNDYDEDFRAISDFVYNSDAVKRFMKPSEETSEGDSDTDASPNRSEAETANAENEGEHAESASTTQSGKQESAPERDSFDDDNDLDDDDAELG